jgi:hypothetical protein
MRSEKLAIAAVDRAVEMPIEELSTLRALRRRR